MELSAAELRNKGIEVQLAVLGADGEPTKKLEKVLIRFTNNNVADIEEKWESLQNWMTDLQRRPVKAIRDTLAIVLKREPEVVGDSMVDGNLQLYGNVIGAALSRWQGATDEQVKKLLAAGDEAAAKADKLMQEMLESESSGEAGSEAGLHLVEPPENSGDSA